LVKKSDYPREEVEFCLSVLVEIMTALRSFKENMVIIGGWVPYFMLREHSHRHIGSLDIDIAFDFKHISTGSYKTILQLLKDRDYRQSDKQPFIFHRHIEGKTVEVNLLAGEYGGTGKSRRTQKFQDINARKARGCDLVFDEPVECELKKEMPGGGVNKVKFKIPGAVPFVTTKGMTLWDRYKEKDAYDIWFLLKNYPGGISKLGYLFKSHLSNKLVKEGLEKVRSKFVAVDSPGPVWVANFLEAEDLEEQQRVQRDAYERIKAFLDILEIEEYRK